MADTPRLSKDQWKQRIRPLLERSLQQVQKAITNERHVQSWIRSASFEAAMSIQNPADVQAEANAYRHLLDDLNDTFPELVEAVGELTGGCGTLDVNWRPLSPEYTSLYIDFGTDYKVDVFCKLKAAAPEEAQRALDLLARALPPSEPFPKRPNKAAGLLSLDDQCLGARLFERHPGDGKPRRSVTLQLARQEPVRDLTPAEAPAQIIDLLTPSGRTISPDEWISS